MENTPNILVIRHLKPCDAKAMLELRLFALQESPAAFGSSYDEEKNKTWMDVRDVLEGEDIFGAFLDGILVGMLGCHVSPLQKLAHKAHIYGVYIRPEWRGKRIMREMLRQALASMARSYSVVQASVVSSNQKALNTFLNAGFEIYGTEKKAMLNGRTYYDLIHVWMDMAMIKVKAAHV